jgi:hypothetical protein
MKGKKPKKVRFDKSPLYSTFVRSGASCLCELCFERWLGAKPEPRPTPSRKETR